ncbi:TetR/AcrR family transcriptional regulator [Leifsonia sp. F6_8S_P_1B]|uniref:TetR/AcrR family transcriptional regulator n=1 Tax=Leifsonia williamsii TaxID=3035919 RepID=A0ABT8KEE0_9MICO|nr:TetR/AcrR family transcriptional regulator [Leifsonia williamsii]MDN4615537.1 TetR/AcrR family transcriptional regulator [Leifsonia williamsii]
MSEHDPAPDPASPRRRGPYAKSAARRQHIVEQAYTVFASRGYHAGSLREIAAAAGVSLSSLQHHFSSKEELLVAVLARRDELGGGWSDSAARLPFAEHIVGQAEANRRIPGLIALYAVLSAEAVTAGHPGRDYFVDRYDGLRDAYTAEFTALREDGHLRDGVDPALAAATVIALWEGVELQWLYAPDRIDAPAALRAYLDLVLT